MMWFHVISWAFTDVLEALGMWIFREREIWFTFQNNNFQYTSCLLVEESFMKLCSKKWPLTPFLPGKQHECHIFILCCSCSFHFLYHIAVEYR
jgi:hypothetical protein